VTCKAFYTSADIPVEAVVVDNDSSDGRPRLSRTSFLRPPCWCSRRTLATGGSREHRAGALPGASSCCLALTSRGSTVGWQDGRFPAHTARRRRRPGRACCLADGRPIQTHEGFPFASTLFYRTVGLSRCSPRSPRFGRYNMGHVPDVRRARDGRRHRRVPDAAHGGVDRVGFFDPRYFMFGEDLDLATG